MTEMPRGGTLKEGQSNQKVLLGTEMPMRCNVVVLQMIEHARIGGVCGQISFNSTLFMFETRRQTLLKVQQSHKATKLDEKYERELSTP